MATYAIGDLQGCFDPLQELVEQLEFDVARDRLWFVGDLVNRGPQSLQVLRYVKSLGEAAICVLGNHDLHLLMVAEGRVRAHSKDTLDEILRASDRNELLDWVRRRPIVHVESGYVLVHAGLLPSWDAGRAAELGREVEQALRGPAWRELMAHMYGNQPDQWDDSLAGYDRLRTIINAMTRLRICDAGGRMEFSHKGRLEDIPTGYVPWFDVPGRASASSTVVCGHWSALGLRTDGNLLALDSGCLWGRSLSAVRLEDRRVYQVPCPKFAD
jgi:bis(5'-nucleosyl)-tetraphosphatase (symmetrical)